MRLLHRLHWKDLRALSEAEQKLDSLDARRECPWYSERRRAVLAWTDAVTFVASGHVPDEVHGHAQTRAVLADHTLAATNACNRLAISAWLAPGSYKAAARVT